MNKTRSLSLFAAILLLWSGLTFSEENSLSPAISLPDQNQRTTLSCDSAFSRAVQHYAQGEWDLARLGFERCLELGKRDFRVYYNLANSWYRLGDLGRAIQHYRIALLIEPGNEAAQENLKLAESLRIDKQEPYQSDPLFAAIWKLHSALSPALCAKLLLAAALLLGLLASALLFAKTKMRNLLIVALLLVAAATFPIFVSAVYKAWGIEFEPRAVILSSVIDLRSSPTHNAQVIGTLHAGAVIEPRHRENGWLLVKVAEGLEGYLQESEIGWINGEGGE